MTSYYDLARGGGPEGRGLWVSGGREAFSLDPREEPRPSFQKAAGGGHPKANPTSDRQRLNHRKKVVSLHESSLKRGLEGNLKNQNRRRREIAGGAFLWCFRLKKKKPSREKDSCPKVSLSGREVGQE